MTEDFYDRNNFHVECNHHGRKWYLKSNDEHLTRGKVLHHPNVISKKQGTISSFLRSQRLKENKSIDRPNFLVKWNRDCEKVLLLHLKLSMDTLISAEVFEPCALVNFYSCKVPSLIDF